MVGGGMRSIGVLWRQEPRARPYFVAVGQSAVGTGAGYVALLLVAYDRLASPWAISLVLLADLVPAIVLGPLLGSLVDRVDRLRCAIAADLLCAAAIAAIAIGGGFAPLLALALVAGVGNALFRPASVALMPAVVPEEHLPAANGLYRALRDSGVMLGPAIAAIALLFTGPTALLLLNAATFAVSAALLSLLQRDRLATTALPAEAGAPAGSLLAETRAGLRTIAGLPAVPALLAACSAAALFGGLMNVAELILARDTLHGGAAGYGLLVAAFGCGQVSGAIIGARDADDATMRRRLIVALGLLGTGLALSGLAGQLAVAATTFLVTGLGTGLLLVSSGILLQRLVPPALHGRAFGTVGALEALALAIAFSGSGLLVAVVGVRGLFFLAGGGMLAVAVVCVPSLIARPPKSAALAAEPKLLL
jgi:MFS family permease